MATNEDVSSSSLQAQLWKALRTNDFVAFQKIINYGAVDLEYVYPHPEYKTCLELSVSQPNKEKYVKLLLQHKVQINNINETYGVAPIHLAVENGNKEALSVLLEDERIDVNLRCIGNNTALLMAIKQAQNKQKSTNGERRVERTIEDYEIIIQMLLKAGCDANSPDLKGVTPIYSAATQKLEKVITYIIEFSREPIDLDRYKDIRGKTARYFLQENFPHLLAKFKSPTKNLEVVNVDILFHYLSQHEEDKFVHDFEKLVRTNKHIPILTSYAGEYTMLQLAIEKGFKKVVCTLLNAGADPNAIFSGNTNYPIKIACVNGYHEILGICISRYNFVGLSESLKEVIKSLLLITVKNMRSTSIDPKVNFRECLNLLIGIDYIKKNINLMDEKGNTALHYAARNGDDETVLFLLRKGACISIRNNFNILPLADINAKTLETYLNECIDYNEKPPSDEGYEIHFKYNFLVYSNNSEENEQQAAPLIDKTNDELLHETEALLYITKNKEMRPLITHPVLTSFLYLKWQRISFLFGVNVAFYFIFCLFLNLYIMSGYCNGNMETKSVKVLDIITHIGACIGLILLMVRESFQFLVSPIRYLQSFENWIEIVLIILTSCIVCYDSAQESTKQQLSAIVILLSSAELVLLIGQLPVLSTYIVILQTVSWNFFKLFLWYCILIIAFALSFYTLFRKDVISKSQSPPNSNNTNENDDEAKDVFKNPGTSLFKTIVMLTGEFDSGSINFSTFPITSRIIFIVFVFMIPIILFNLLNGLAVSDTQEIRADAELVGHVSRVKLISYFEAVLIGKADTSKQTTFWLWPPIRIRYLPIIKQHMLYIKPLARSISLFPLLFPKYRIIVKPNERNRIYTDSFAGEVVETYYLDDVIVKHAGEVINKKTNISEIDEMKNLLRTQQSKLESLEGDLKSVLRAIESLNM